MTSKKAKADIVFLRKLGKANLDAIIRKALSFPGARKVLNDSLIITGSGRPKAGEIRGTGFFSFIKRAIKAVVKVGKVALPIAKAIGVIAIKKVLIPLAVAQVTKKLVGGRMNGRGHANRRKAAPRRRGAAKKKPAVRKSRARARR